LKIPVDCPILTCYNICNQGAVISEVYMPSTITIDFEDVTNYRTEGYIYFRNALGVVSTAPYRLATADSTLNLAAGIYDVFTSSKEGEAVYMGRINIDGVTAGNLSTLLQIGDVGPTNVTATSKTLALSDAGTVQAATNASTQTFAIPLNASVAFPIGTFITFEQLGAGIVIVDAVAGVLLNGVDGSSKATPGQFSSGYIRKIDTDSWIAIGFA